MYRLTTAFLVLSLAFITQVQANSGDLFWSAFTGGNIGSSPTVSYKTNYIYIGAADGYVYAFDIDGKVQWRFNAEGHVGATPALSADEQVLYVASYSGAVFALQAKTGGLLWRYDTGDSIYSSAAIASDGTVYVGSNDQTVYALQGTSGALLWSFTTGGKVGASPAIGQNGMVYVGAGNGVLYALDPTNSDSRLSWTFTLGAGVASAAIGINNQLYVGGFDQKLYAIDTSAEALSRALWETTLGGRVAANPVIGANGTLYATTFDDGQLHAINQTNGQVIWSFDTDGEVYGSAAVSQNGYVYFGSFNKTLYALDPSKYNAAAYNQNDLIVWSHETESPIVSSPSIAFDSTVLVASSRSVLYAFEDDNGGLANTPWPMFRRGLRHAGNNDDSDGDGLPDAWEITYGFDPTVAGEENLDGDDDGLLNYQEVFFGAAPNNADSDGDGMPDGWEVINHFNPIDGGDAETDADGDGVHNLDEFLNGTNPNDSTDFEVTAIGEVVWQPSPALKFGNHGAKGELFFWDGEIIGNSKANSNFSYLSRFTPIGTDEVAWDFELTTCKSTGFVYVDETGLYGRGCGLPLSIGRWNSQGDALDFDLLYENPSEKDFSSLMDSYYGLGPIVSRGDDKRWWLFSMNPASNNIKFVDMVALSAAGEKIWSKSVGNVVGKPGMSAIGVSKVIPGVGGTLYFFASLVSTCSGDEGGCAEAEAVEPVSVVVSLTKDGLLRWVKEVDGWKVPQEIKVVDLTMSHDGNIYIELASGTKEISWYDGSIVKEFSDAGTMLTAGDGTLILSSGETVVAYDNNGTEKWRVPGHYAAISESNIVYFIRAGTDWIYRLVGITTSGVEVLNVTLQWVDMFTRGYVYLPPDNSGRIYVRDVRGWIAIQAENPGTRMLSTTSHWPTRYQNAQGTPRLTSESLYMGYKLDILDAEFNASIPSGSTTHTFQGEGSSPTGTDVSGSIRWRSNIDGELGVGEVIPASMLSLGEHVITAYMVLPDGSEIKKHTVVQSGADNAPKISDLSVKLTGDNGKWDSTTKEYRYKTIVSNGGPAVATGVVVAFTFPSDSSVVSMVPSVGSCDQGAATCTFGDVAVDDVVEVVLTLSRAAKNALAHSVIVTSTSADEQPSNNSASGKFGGSIGLLLFALMAVLSLRRLVVRKG